MCDDGRLRCPVCPRHCRLADGQRGLCRVRRRQADRFVLATYGRASGFCIDPVEKKPLNHFLPGTPVLSFGTAGCNLKCRFCQNCDLTTAKSIDDMVVPASPEAIAAAAVAHGCSSVAFTYNDPVIFFEYAIDVAAACRDRGIRSVAVTAGYVCPEPRAALFRAVDAANVDLKAFTETFYREQCGGDLRTVLETLAYIRTETDVWLELTTLLIPGLNDSDSELEAMTRWVYKELGPDVPMHFTAFHPAHHMTDRPATPPETLTRARDIAAANGIRYPYTGNVSDLCGQNTVCHRCGALLIERCWYQLGIWNLDREGRCTACGTKCAGIFDAAPGTWGGRRQPIRI